MTERKWLTASDPAPLLTYNRGTASDRKLRLFAVAACRTVWHHFPNRRCQLAVDAAELFADGLMDENELSVARAGALDTIELIVNEQFKGVAWARVSAEAATVPVLVPQLAGTAPLLRDIFGNPFCPVTVDPIWLTSTVTSLTAVIYAERAFDRMPILADALEDAGCDNIDILSHCRGDGPHVRGCWVVDLLLGKE